MLIPAGLAAIPTISLDTNDDISLTINSVSMSGDARVSNPDNNTLVNVGSVSGSGYDLALGGGNHIGFTGAVTVDELIVGGTISGAAAAGNATFQAGSSLTANTVTVGRDGQAGTLNMRTVFSGTPAINLYSGATVNAYAPSTFGTNAISMSSNTTSTDGGRVQLINDTDGTAFGGNFTIASGLRGIFKVDLA